MTTKRKNTLATNIFRNVLAMVMFFSLSYAQELDVISFQAGSIQTLVDVRRGNFSMFDKDQKDLDFMSFLFGGATNPDSYFTVTVDGESHTLDQMQVIRPFKITLGSQVDGSFYAGRDILVEVAFFSLDLINTGDFNSVGIILKLSNVSISDKNVGVKFVLDTDIGESQNRPLIYSSSGEILDSSYVFKNTPKFLFFGEGNVLANNVSSKGFYLYPYVSEILPSYMAVANWRRLFEKKEIEDGMPFSYGADTIKDIGIELHYGDFVLEEDGTAYVGLVISKQQSIVSPVLSEESISKGVFNEDRFKIEALLNKTPNIQQVFVPEPRESVRQLLPEYIPSDSIWGYLYKLNSDMKRSSGDIDSRLRPYSLSNSTFFQGQ